MTQAEREGKKRAGQRWKAFDELWDLREKYSAPEVCAPGAGLDPAPAGPSGPEGVWGGSYMQ